MLTYNQVYRALIRAKGTYLSESRIPSKRYKHKRDRYLRLAKLTEILARDVYGREGSITIDRVQISLPLEEIARQLKLSPSTLRASYIPLIFRQTGLAYIFI